LATYARGAACSGQGSLTVTCVAAEELLACADGAAPLGVREHVEGCEHCAAEVASYTRAHQALKQRFFRFKCPPPEALGDYELTVLPEEERVALAQHVVECPRCTEDLRTLRSFLRASSAAEPEISAFAQVRRVMATAFAPPRNLAYGGLRGATTPTSATYRTGSLSVKLEQSATPGRRESSVIGLIWGTDDREATLRGEARLVSELASLASPIDDLGNFTFARVPHGAHQLELHLSEQIVVVEALRIGS
jgi:hypothetical protein